MVKFKLSNNDGKLLIGIGLSAENVKRLQDGQPIYATLEDMGLEKTEIAIVFGDTEQSIIADMQDQGLVPNE